MVFILGVFYITQTLKVWQIYLHLPYKNWSNVGKYTGPMECLGFTVLHLAWIRNLTSEIQRSIDFGKLLFRGQTTRSCPPQQKTIGGCNFKYSWNFHPDPWGDDPIWRAYFSDGLVQPQLENMLIFGEESHDENIILQEAARTIETTYLRSYGGRLESQWWTLFGCWDLDRFMEGKAEAKKSLIFFWFRLKWKTKPGNHRSYGSQLFFLLRKVMNGCGLDLRSNKLGLKSHCEIGKSLHT